MCREKIRRVMLCYVMLLAVEGKEGIIHFAWCGIFGVDSVWTVGFCRRAEGCGSYTWRRFWGIKHVSRRLPFAVWL